MGGMRILPQVNAPSALMSSDIFILTKFTFFRKQRLWRIFSLSENPSWMTNVEPILKTLDAMGDRNFLSSSFFRAQSTDDRSVANDNCGIFDEITVGMLRVSL